MLNTDKDAIDRAYERCSAGGADNHYGDRLNVAKFQEQADDYIQHFVTVEAEAHELRGYVGTLIADTDN